MTISCEKGKNLTFCCAYGEYRGPHYAQKVSGSKYDDLGYTGLTLWLQGYKRGQSEHQLRLFYNDAFFILIVDESDKANPELLVCLEFVCTLLCRARIPYRIMTSLELNDLILSPTHFVLD